MKLLATISASAIALAGFASAATQQSVVGPSGIQEWPLKIRGTNNVMYICKEPIYVRDGLNVRDCRPEDAGNLFDNGQGVTAAAGVGGAIVALALIVGGSSSSTTTTTTGTGN